MVRSLAQRGLPKPFAILVAALLALYFVPLAALPANAAVPTFEIDGNLADDAGAGIDWQTLHDANDPALVVRNDNGTAIGDASVFSTSSKENDVVAGENTPAQWTKGSPNTAPPKTDVANYYKYIRTGDDGHIELFFAWDRLSPSGTDYYYLELNQKPNTTTGAPGTADYFSVPNRTAGDVRFTIHELGNLDLVLLGIDKWDGTKWVSQPIVPGGFDGEVNAVDISPAGFDSPAIAKNGPSKGTIPADQFFETAFDLTTLIGLEPSCPSLFGTMNFRSATGESAQETGDNLKDYLEPIALDAPSTCGSLSIIKHDDQGAPLGGATFRITPNPLPAGVPGSGLSELVIFDDSDANTTVEAGTNYDDPTAAAGSIVLDQVVPGSYEITELSAPAGYELEAGVKTADVPEGGSDSVTFTNVRELGKIKIKKIMQGDPVGASTDFTAHVDCPGTAYDQDVALNSGNGWVNVTGNIPTGLECTVTEPTVPTGWTFVSTTPADGKVTVVKGTPAEVQLTVTNLRDVGKIKIKKVTQGDPAGASTDFTAHVDCPGTAYDQDVALNSGNGWVNVTGDIPTGLECTVTEPSVPAGWTLVGTNPADGKVTVTKGTPAEVQLTITNQRLTGGYLVHKAIVGDVAGAGTEFTVTVNCDNDTYDRTIVLNQGNDWTSDVFPVPSGVACDVTETGIPAGWSLQSISPEHFVIGESEATVVVEVTNTRNTGVITVTKNLVGDVAGASTSFTFDVNCPGDAYDQSLTIDVTNGSSASKATGQIPTGLTCTVTERSTPGWSLTQTVPANGTVGVGSTVTFTNTRQTGVITVTKNLVGAANGASTTFSFNVDCPGTAYDQSLSIAVTNGVSGSKTTTAIPTGLTCTVTEPSVPDWKLTAVVPANGAVQPGQTVTFTNTRLAGALNIVKAVSPVAGGGTVVEFGDTLTYTLTVSATGEQRQPNVVVTDFLPGRDPAHPTSGETTYVAGSAACVGAGACTVSGPDAAGKLTWALGEMAAGTTRQVTFKVKINDVAGQPGEVVAVDILNQGAVKSDRTGVIPSNVVKTPVSKVLPVKIPRELPHTGTTLPLGPTVGGAVLLLGLGLLLLVGTHRRQGWGSRR